MLFGSYICGVQGHFLFGGVPDSTGEGGFGGQLGQTPSQNSQLQIAAVTWWIEMSDSTFSQIM